MYFKNKQISKTFITVIIFTISTHISLNFTLHGQHHHTPSYPQWTDEKNVTEEILIYNVTELRLNPNYMYYYIHWTRSAVGDKKTNIR